MHRRKFMQACLAAGGVLPAACCTADTETAEEPQVMTVAGRIPAKQLGAMLPHEHILVDFIGADRVDPDRYDADEAFRVMLPYLEQAREAGCRAMAECTPAYLGRNPLLLKRLAEASGVTLLTNTGYYGAREGKFLPPHAFRENAIELAGRWIREWQDGINGTGLRPGFIKIGVDAGELTEVNQKLVEAAARCHRETGLTIAGHTGDGAAALQQVEILKGAGVAPEAWIWVHAQNERNHEVHRRVAESGAWVEFDGVRPESIERHVELVMAMRRADLLDHVLISQDAGWFSVGEPRGGQVRGFETLFTQFLPALRRAGLSDREVTQLTVTNPAKALNISA